MNAASLIICRDFIARFHPEAQERLLNLLSPLEKEKLSSLGLPQGTPSKGISSKEEILRKVHPSHFEVVLKPLSTDVIALYLSLLDPEIRKDVQKKLGFSEPLSSLSPNARDFLTEKLYHLLVKNFELLPPECLPLSELNPLLHLSYEKLTSIITFWGLYDLAHELRYIIDKALLQQVYGALTQKENHYLQDLMTVKEKIYVQRLHLERYDLTKETMRNLVHQRGLIRLAHALYKQSKSYLWYLFHLLDTQRIEVIKKHLLKEDHANESPYLKEQLKELLHSFQKHF